MNRGQNLRRFRLGVWSAMLATGLLLLVAVAGRAQDRSLAETPAAGDFLGTLSAAERAWLREHPVITVSLDPSWPPIEFTDEHGTPSGMTTDYLRLIEARLGVRFQRVPNLSWQEAYARMQRWEIDLATTVAVTAEREKFWAFTKPYMTIPIVVVTRTDVTYIADLRELAGRKVAVVEGNAPAVWIARDFPEIHLVQVKTTQESLALLQRGEVFACVDNMLVVGSYLAGQKMTDLKVAGTTPYTNAQCMAVRKDWAPLAAILDKVLDSVSPAEREAIYRRWLPLRYDPGVDYTRFWPVAGLFAAVLAGLVAWNWKLARETRTRQRAEAALHETNTRLTAVMENLSEGLIMGDDRGRTLYWNPAALALNGYTNMDDCRRHLAEFAQTFEMRLLDDDRPLPVADWPMSRVLRGERLHDCAFRLRRLDQGWEKIIAYSGWLIRHDGGEKFVFLSATDITERRQGEQALRASEVRYRRLFETAKDGILILDAETGMIVDVNPFLIGMLGYTRQEFLGKKVWELGFFQNLVANEDNFAELQAKEYIRYEDMALETKDGRRIEVEFISNVYEVGGQKVIQCNIREIAARVRAEKIAQKTLAELEQARQVLLSVVEDQKESADQLRKLSAIIEQAPLSVVITDLDGAIEYVNPRFTLVTGYTAAEALGQNPRILQSGETPPEVYHTMWETLRRGEVWTGELTNRTKRGERYRESVVIAPVVDQQGRATHYVALKDDITAKQRHEADLVAKLAREQELSEMKTRFISVTSHEFRTPMAAAMGSAELLANHLDRLSAEKRQELLARITASLHRMTEMLDEVLLLNRIDANRVEVRLAPLDLRSFVHQTIEEIRLGDRDQHRFDFHVTGEPRGFPSDTNLLHHILSNLLSNAVRFSPAGTLITVRLAADAGEAQVAVEDRGIGIPEADHARIFEPFERGSNVGTIKGTGLGLNIVKRMTTLLGGTVTLAAVEGGGSCFTITLPRLPHPTPAPVGN